MFYFPRIVSLLLPVTSRAKIRQSGITPLHLAAEFNQEKVVSFLIKSGCDVNASLSHERSSMFHDHRSTALYCAVTAGNREVVDLLLKAGANPNLDPLSPLLVALRQGCFRTITTLVKHGADVNAHVPAHPTDFPGVLLYTHSMGILQYLLDNGCEAQECFRCDHTDSRQLASQSRMEDTDQTTHSVTGNAFPSQTICTESTTRNLQVQKLYLSLQSYYFLFYNIAIYTFIISPTFIIQLQKRQCNLNWKCIIPDNLLDIYLPGWKQFFILSFLNETIPFKNVSLNFLCNEFKALKKKFCIRCLIYFTMDFLIPLVYSL